MDYRNSQSALPAPPEQSATASSSGCPSCGAYVGIGASDCAKCGFVFGATDPRNEKAHGVVLNAFLIVMTASTVLSLIVVLLSAWSAYAHGRTAYLLFAPIQLAVAGVQLRGIWSMWYWKREGVFQYFIATAAVLVFSLFLGAFRWNLVSGVTFNAAFLYYVYREWDRFE